MLQELENYLDDFQIKYDALFGIFVCESEGQILIYNIEESSVVIENLEQGKEIIKNHFENWHEDMLKWKKEFLEEVKTYANDQLLWRTVAAAQGDDWDGMFTPKGERAFKMMREELERRLKEIKFL